MNTRILVDHEPVADGGSFVRATLLMDGAPASDAGAPRPPGAVASIGSPHVPRAHRSARNVHVSVFPGRDAEFVQLTHPFTSRGAGDLLTIEVGDVYEVDRVRIRMDALVAGAEDVEEDVEVSRIVVFAQVRSPAGGALGRTGWELRAMIFPIMLSAAHGCRVRAHVRTIPCSIDPSSPTVELPLEDTQWAV